MSATQQLLRFGVFELNLDTQVLRKSGTPIKLAPQPFRLLALLASRSGQIVSREEIQQQLWGQETYVDFEHGMNKCIKQIRTVLGDDPDHPSYIETLPRQGYRFLAPVISKSIPVPRPQVTESKSGEIVRMPLLVNTPAATRTSAAVAPHPVAMPATEAPAQELEIAHPDKDDRRTARVRLLRVVAAVVLAGMIAGWLYWRAHRRPVLTETDTIVLSNFDDNTGERVFDVTLRQGLSAYLEQSPFLNILSERRIAETMALMTQPKDAVLTAALARDVCVRSGSAATVEGAIARLGRDYVVGLTAVDCHTGGEIAVEQFTVNDKEKILPELGKAASRIRRKLGESLPSIQKYDVPLVDVTTPSFDALRAFSLGRKAEFTNGSFAALPFYQNAVELDPNFAIAYAAMAIDDYNLGRPEVKENAQKAYELRNKVSERERLAIDGIYYLFVTGEWEKAAQVYEVWEQIYPRDPLPYNNLSKIYGDIGRPENGLEQALEAVRLDPNRVSGYNNLAAYYVDLGRLDEAEAAFKQAEQHGLQSEALLNNRYELAFLRGDKAQMAQLLARGLNTPGSEHVLLASQAGVEAWYGKMKNARAFTKRAMDAARRNGSLETTAGYQILAARSEIDAGNREWGRAEAEGALKLSRNGDVPAEAAIALARAGVTAEPEKIAAELDRSAPHGTRVQEYWIPTIRAAVALSRKDPQRAVELLRVTSSTEMGDLNMYPAYLRGEAYLMLTDGKAAAAEFQKIIEHRAHVGALFFGALARLGLARAYLMQGDREKARAAYQDFLTLWKDADPDIPIYKQAKAEYAKLQ